MKKSGFTLIEILIAIALSALFLPAIGMALSFALQTSSQGEKYSKAYSHAQEGMEAIIFLKAQNDTDWDWTSTPAETNSAEYYQPNNSSGTWILGSILNTVPAPYTLSSTFSRRIEIKNISPDVFRRKIIVHVAWKENGQDQEIKLEGYVSQH